MSDFQIDGIKIFKEGEQTIIKIPTSELERISKELKPVDTLKSVDTVTPVSQPETPQTHNKLNAKTRVFAPALGQTRGGKRRLNRRKTSKKNKME